MNEEQIQELIRTGKKMDIDILNEKRVKLFNYLNRKHIDIVSLRGKVGICKGIFLTSLKEKHGSNLSTVPFLKENLFYIFVDESFYLNNKAIVEFQITHEMLHGLFNQKNNYQILFGHLYQNKEQISEIENVRGINEACTQMITEDIEEEKLDSLSDYMYDIKNIMRIMKIIYGEEYILKQYIYNNKDFETLFNKLSNNQFNILAHQINLIYRYDKKKYYKKLLPEEEQYINRVKNTMYNWLIKLIDYYKKDRPEIIKEIIDEINDDEFLLKININQNNFDYNK